MQLTKVIYTIYIHYISIRAGVHNLPIKMKKHAALRLIQRFDMSIDELRHVIKTGKQIKKPERDGEIGIIERKFGDGKIRIKYKIQDHIVWIITVEGGRGK